MTKPTSRIHQEHPYADIFTTWAAWQKALKAGDTRLQKPTHAAYVKARAALL